MQGDVFRLPNGSLCVADPVAAAAVLSDEDDNYVATARTEFSSATRAAAGRAVRDVLRRYLADRRERLPALAAELGPVSVWPEAGTELVYRHVADALLHPQSPPALTALLSQVVRRSALVRTTGRLARIPQRVLRARLTRALAHEIRVRRIAVTGEPWDLLDAVVGATPPDTPDTAVAELYLLLCRTVLAPVGYLVGWALLALAAAGIDPSRVPVEWSVRETLRLWPVTWLFGRPVGRAHDVGGVHLEPGESVSVSAYLLHRDDRCWPDAARFRPERWVTPAGHGPYLPFGGGPFSRVGEPVAVTLATDVLDALTAKVRVAVDGGGPPLMEGIMVPPVFVLYRHTAGWR